MFRLIRVRVLVLIVTLSFGGFVVSQNVVADCPVGDLNWDCKVNLADLWLLTSRWLDPNCLAPGCQADIDGLPGVGLTEFSLLAGGWQEDGGAIVHIKWLGHASFRIRDANTIIYIDPRNLAGSAHDASLVLVSHTHSDHYSPADIAKIWGPQTQLIAPADVIAKEPQERKDRAILLLPGQTIQAGGVRITGVAAYNANHPKTNNWLGFIADPVRKDSSFVVSSGLRSRYGGVDATEKESRFSNGVEIGSMRIYDAGDTGLTDEMKALRNIEVAILPVDGVYTMSAEQAAEATTHIKPKLAIPDHWGDIVGTRADAEKFDSLAQCDVKIMDVGETISSAGWLKDFPLIAYWQLDETGGTTAYDIAGENDGTINGGAIWQPTGGAINGALQLDGTNDYVSTPFILNPSSGEFSAMAWVKGGASGQVVVSQQSTFLFPQGKDWLCADPTGGRLMTALTDGSPSTSPLVSEFVITDGEWHYIAVTWDGSRRRLYADGIKVAEDSGSLANLVSSNTGLNLGAGRNRSAGTFWSGLIDDIRIYDHAITP